MKHWTTKRILISALMLFSVLGAISVQWGNIADFTASNQFSSENYFGLNRVNDQGDILINQTILGPSVWAIVLILLILIWKKLDENLELQMILSFLVLIVALSFLKIISGNPVYWLAIHIPVFPPVAWMSFGFACLWLILNERCLSDKLLIWIATITFLLLGDLVHGWFGYFSTNTLIAILSFVLHLLVILSWMAWMIVLLIPVAVAMGLAVALAIVIVFACLAIVFVCLLVVIGIIVLIIFTLCGINPRELGNYIKEFLLYLVGGDDPHW